MVIQLTHFISPSGIDNGKLEMSFLHISPEVFIDSMMRDSRIKSSIIIKCIETIANGIDIYYYLII